MKRRTVNLADRGRRDRIVGETGVRLACRYAELRFEDTTRQCGGHGRRLGLKSSQCLLVRRDSAVGTVHIDARKDLSCLHQNAFGVPEEFGVALGCAVMEAVDGSGVSGLFA
ncbi:Uncharacterised protein [Mycobacteroides abscessus subsp. abscessus]|nr:Uncharacterised protein [Mycobacteroides abscessus subsp. abscessus]